MDTEDSSILRSLDPESLEVTEDYVATIGSIMVKAQITNGGPIVLFQPEKAYSSWPDVNNTDFPPDWPKEYNQHFIDKFRKAGVGVPFINNDNLVLGSFASGTGSGEYDIYGIDAYPSRYDCAHPEIWPTYRFPRDWHIYHQQQSPSTPFLIPEFQGGTGTSWV